MGLERNGHWSAGQDCAGRGSGMGPGQGMLRGAWQSVGLEGVVRKLEREVKMGI